MNARSLSKPEKTHKPINQMEISVLAMISLFLGGFNFFVGSDAISTLFLIFMIFISGTTFFLLGKASAIGILFGLFCVKTFWLAALIKPIFFEPFESSLHAPFMTLTVYVLATVGMFLAATLCALYNPKRGLLPLDDMSTSFVRDYSLYLCLIGLFCWILLRVTGGDARVGGLWGVIKTFTPLGIVGLALFLYTLDKVNYKNKKDISLFSFLVASYFMTGVIGASKEQMMMPLVIGFLGALRVHGLKSLKVWLTAFLGVMFFIVIVYPYAQYTRTTGIRGQSLGDAMEMAGELSVKVLTDPAFRDSLKEKKKVENVRYAPEAAAGFGRLMFIGEADYLIFKTTEKQDFTGSKTITHGFEMIVPHALHPNKPQYNTGAFLGNYTGQIPLHDTTTQISYGFIANLYNAYGLFWVLPSTFILTFLMFTCMKLYWGSSRTLSPSVIIVIMTMHHSFIEGTVSTQVQVIRQPLNFAILFFGLYLWTMFKQGKMRF